MAGEFDGLVAAVTGGASGIGAAIARRLMADGARVAVLDRDVSEPPEGALAVQADVTDDASVRAAVDRVLQEWDRLDVLVNNAGIGSQGTVADNPDDEWHRVLDVNLLGMVRTTRAALVALRRSPSAAIVNTGSIAATAGLPQRAVYSASKGAANQRNGWRPGRPAARPPVLPGDRGGRQAPARGVGRCLIAAPRSSVATACARSPA